MTTNQSEDEGLRKHLIDMPAHFYKSATSVKYVFADETVDDLMVLISQKILEARIDELSKVDPIASHQLAATVSDRIATLTQGIKE